MLDLASKRRRLDREISAKGIQHVGIAELDLRSRKDANRHLVVARLEVSFDEAVDVLGLFSGPTFDGIGNIAEISYRHSDINAAISHLREAALARAQERAAVAFAGLDWQVESVQYRMDHTRLKRKSKYRQMLVNVGAIVLVRGTGNRLNDL